MRTMRIMGVAAMAAAGLALAPGLGGCATGPGYVEVPAARPAATVRVFKSYQGTSVGVAASQTYSLAPDTRCAGAGRAASFGQMMGSERTLRVEPDRPLVLWSTTAYLSSGVVRMANYDARVNSACTAGVRFTPLRGHAYDARQTSSFGAASCGLEVTDRATGAAPEGLEVLALPGCEGPAAG